MLAGDVLVVADRAQHPAERRARQALQQDECHCEHRQDDAQEALLEHLWRDDAAPAPGMPAMPSAPLVSQISLVAAMRTDSEKPSVTIVR